jgi:hypothetical protein
MKSLTISFLSVILLTASLRLAAQSDDNMKAWMNYMTPSDMHKELAKSVGTWIGETTMWMAPGAQPMKSASKMVYTMIMGGRYLSGTATGNINGMPFEGMSIVGYDNAKKIFEQSWVDNMGTGIMKLEGPWDDATKSAIMKGTETDPMSGKQISVKETITIVSDNSQLIQMFMIGPDGKEMKTMEIKYTRTN